MKTKIALFVMAVALSLNTAASAQTNGSFEASGCFGFGFIEPFAGSNLITGWTIGGQGVDLVCTYWEASAGSNSLDVNRVGPGSVSQNISTVAGYTYQVTFDMSGNPDGPIIAPGHPWNSPTNKVLGVSVDGSAPTLYSYDTAVEDNTRSDMLWRGNAYYFVAGDTSSTLTFASQIPGAFGPTLDNVVVSLVTQVCHRNKGKAPFKTLTPDPEDVADHLGHGDQAGPCEE